MTIFYFIITGLRHPGRHRCMGCHLGLSNDSSVLCCHFSDTGFPFTSGHQA
jgi:hypothetical protein